MATPAPKTVREAPLSFSQQRLWFLSHLEPESRAYHLAKAFLLAGPLDVPALQDAFSALSDRQAVLKTTYHVGDRGPVQRVNDRREPLVIHDLTDLPEDERLDAAQELASAESNRLYDFEKDFPLRASVYRLDSDSHLLAVSYHHIATDAWSTGILWRELAELYRAAVTKTESTLTPLPVQYVDYAGWQRESVGSEKFVSSAAHWRQALRGAPALSTFPSDRSRPAVQSYRGARLPIRIDATLLDGLLQLGRQQRVTLFMVLLAALNALLFRYSGQKDIVIGSPIAGRSRTEFEPLIGFFVNNLVLRNDLSADPSFRDFLQHVRGVCLDAFEHQDVPFERLVEELAPERSPAYSPLFQVALSMRGRPERQLTLEGLTTQPLEVQSTSSKFDWWLSLVQQENCLDGFLEYNTDLFDSDEARSHRSSLMTLLESCVSDPDRRLSQLDVVAPVALKSLEAWNQTAMVWKSPLLPFQQFETIAARDGERTAVSTPSGRMTYAELNGRANRLAHFLIKRGVRLGTRVGLHVGRSSEALIAVLAIMKSGGVYVPMDAEYPNDRLRYIGEKAGIALRLTSSESASSLPGDAIILRRERDRIASCPDRNPDVDLRPESLAYINFTSGSTGRPKGVVVPQSALKNFLESMRQRPGLEPTDTLFSVTSLSFDISVLELLLPLVVGATVYIVPAGVARDGERLRALLEQSGATVMQSTRPPDGECCWTQDGATAPSRPFLAEKNCLAHWRPDCFDRHGRSGISMARRRRQFGPRWPGLTEKGR